MKKRADIVMVEQGLVSSRARAQREIISGHVFSGLEIIAKPSQKIPHDTPLRLVGDVLSWVSVAALKLVHGLDTYGLSVEGRVILDLGASTGGFSEVCLARGAAHVFAVDVGHGQLHPRVAKAPRLTSIEGLNARNLKATDLAGPIDGVVCDLSFISLKLGLAPALEICEPGGILVALIKPQFEAGKSRLSRGGIVKDPQVREDTVEDIRTWLDKHSSWNVLGTCESPVAGSDGNQEYLIAAQKITD
jgi:23S rRNA (cytidine1920-2'-O)/16S rRNA (cytidine1409-2'-O)-methyltransferase